MKKGDFYLGIFFLVLSLVLIYRNYAIGWINFFWMCDFVPFLFSLAFFSGRRDLVKAVINLSFFPQIVYLLSVILLVFFGISYFEGVSFLLEVGWVFIVLTLFLHMASVFAFLFTYKEKTPQRILFYSFLLVLVVNVVMILFTDPANNVNYVFLLENYFGVKGLSLLWTPFVFVLVILPTYFIQKLSYIVSRG